MTQYINVEGRIISAILPQLDALEDLFHKYSPRKIGKHHPEYVAPKHQDF